MKGIVLAGGYGTRLLPVTQSLSKHLLPIYDKPMIYYPIATLMMSGIRDILIVAMSNQVQLYQELLGSGEQWGVRFEYATQTRADGIAKALLIGERFIANEPVCLILGDNILYGHGLPSYLQNLAQHQHGAHVFGYYVRDPERYGVVNFDASGKPCGIEEKPKLPKSHYAVIGLYFYDHQVVDIAKSLSPSARGEYEITDVNRIYLERQQLSVDKIGRGIAWLDTGTHASLLDAARFVEVLEKRQSLKISCPEEIAWRMGYITEAQLLKLAEPLRNSGYGEYLLRVVQINESL